jgi:AraC family transcriptional regulator
MVLQLVEAAMRGADIETDTENTPALEASPGEFPSDETHGILRLPASRVHALSDGLGWTSVHACVQSYASFAHAFAARPDAFIPLNLEGSATITRCAGGQSAVRQAQPGRFSIVPPQMDFHVAVDGQVTSLHLYVRKAVIDEVAADFFGGDPGMIEIIPRFGASDPVIEQLAMSVRAALVDPPDAATLYTDHVARALAARLLSNHSNAPARPIKELRPQGLRRVVLNRVKDFIEAHLEGPLSLSDLVAGSGLSAGHFAREFKRSTGLSPHQYVLRARTDRAKSLLKGSDATIAGVALACGFADQEHLTKVFKRLTGTTPAAYRSGCR